MTLVLINDDANIYTTALQVTAIARHVYVVVPTKPLQLCAQP